MPQQRYAAWFLLIGLFLAFIIACESRPSSEEVSKETSSNQMTQETGSKEGVAPVAAGGLLVAPAASLGRSANDEGVDHGQQGHWDVAEKAFRKAIETDDSLAEAHFNLGIALDKQGKHEEAAKSFKKAAALAPTNKLITESEILKKHASS
jgi:Flp pilus assembly protein TadD